MRISDWSSDVCSSDLRLLKLKAPADDGAARLQTYQQPGERAEGGQDAGGIGESVQTHLPSFARTEARQSQRLDEQHGKDARHQIEQQPAAERQHDGLGQADRCEDRKSTRLNSSP